MGENECVFCRIIRREIPSPIIFEDDKAIAFLDREPVAIGHALVVPKKHAETMLGIEDEELKELIVRAKIVAKKILKATGSDSFNLTQNNGKNAGQAINHVHFHIIPRFFGDGKEYNWKKITISEGEKESLAKKIRGE